MSEAAPPLRIFISYRRDDSQGFARSIHDRLALHFGAEAVFRDINDIQPGRPWEEAIDAALGSCDVFVLLIGRRWLEATDDEGNRRINDPEDRHRREIETAIHRQIRIFVALMEDAEMPRAKELPQSAVGPHEGIRQVPALHALRIADHAFDYGVEELIANIERAAEQQRAEAERERAEAAQRQSEADAEREREEEERRRAEAAERERAEATERERAEATARERAEREAKPAEKERKTDTPAGERTRRTRTIAALAVGAVIVVVGAIVLLSSGGGERRRSDRRWPGDRGQRPSGRSRLRGGWAVGGKPPRRVGLVHPGRVGQGDRPGEDRRRTGGHRGRPRLRLRLERRRELGPEARSGRRSSGQRDPHR